MAPTPDGAGAYADHEPTASGGSERRAALEEEVVAGSGTGTTGGDPVSAMGEPAAARPAGVAGPTEPNDRRAEPGNRKGSGKVSCGAALADASRGRVTDGAGLRADHRESGPVSVWQADRVLSGTGAVGEVEREAAPAGTYHETRELAAAFPISGSGASYGAQPPGMAEQVCPPDDAARTEDRQGRHGAETGGSHVLDDAQGMGLRAVEKVRFAHGKARIRRWCEVKHREIDWVSRSPSRGSSN